ncbi:MAG: hypothetical protein GY820_20035 [Gammaproteobacteria bacterium]|nr:hypothetical protein [Gammaproteobacteria bacterium]
MGVSLNDQIADRLRQFGDEHIRSDKWAKIIHLQIQMGLVLRDPRELDAPFRFYYPSGNTEAIMKKNLSLEKGFNRLVKSIREGSLNEKLAELSIGDSNDEEEETGLSFCCFSSCTIVAIKVS